MLLIVVEGCTTALDRVGQVASKTVCESPSEALMKKRSKEGKENTFFGYILLHRVYYF